MQTSLQLRQVVRMSGLSDQRHDRTSLIFFGENRNEKFSINFCY
jgi:hypothetical protein